MTDLVEIDNLNIRFTGDRTVHAVNDLSLSLGEGEVLGLLGESGSGKSVTLRALLRLLGSEARRFEAAYHEEKWRGRWKGMCARRRRCPTRTLRSRSPAPGVRPRPSLPRSANRSWAKS